MNEDQNKVPNYLQIIFNRLLELEEDVKELRAQRVAACVAPKEENQLFTVDEAAEFLSVSRTTIYQLKAHDRIPFMQKGKRLYFTKENLMKWLEEDSHYPISQPLTNQITVQRYLKPRRKKLGS